MNNKESVGKYLFAKNYTAIVSKVFADVLTGDYKGGSSEQNMCAELLDNSFKLAASNAFGNIGLNMTFGTCLSHCIQTIIHDEIMDKIEYGKAKTMLGIDDEFLLYVSRKYTENVLIDCVDIVSESTLGLALSNKDFDRWIVMALNDISDDMGLETKENADSISHKYIKTTIDNQLDRISELTEVLRGTMIEEEVTEEDIDNMSEDDISKLIDQQLNKKKLGER